MVDGRYLFWTAIIAATYIPLVGYPVAFALGGRDALTSFPGVASLVVLTGPGHVAATAFFYTDAEWRPFLRENPLRFAIAPIAMLVVFAAAAALDPVIWAVTFALFSCWQLYHYQRQNYGLLSLAAQSDGAGKVPRGVSTALDLAAIAGMLGIVGPGGLAAGFLTAASSVPIERGTYGLGIALYLAAIVYAAILRSRNAEFFSRPLTGLVGLAGIAFFLPAIVSRDYVVTVWSYAIAHGLQYIIVMSIQAGRSETPTKSLLNLVIASCATCFGMMWLVKHQGASYGAYFGIVAAHFVLDARLWRMREVAVGLQMKRRFGFLFC